MQTHNSEPPCPNGNIKRNGRDFYGTTYFGHDSAMQLIRTFVCLPMKRENGANRSF